jgi:acetylornithine deacetylase
MKRISIAAIPTPYAAAMDALERQVSDHVARNAGALVELLQSLIGYDTVAADISAPGGDVPALQRFLADRLARRGAAVTLEEPDVSVVAGHPFIPEGFSFAGRPQLAARFAGAGGGRTLLLNGHVDVVSVEPRDAWSTDPFGGELRGDAVYGRGACDMKGGVAAMTFAAEVLAELGVPLRGDLIVNTVSDEETTGAGGLVSARTLRADAAIVPEPSALGVWIACRGSLLATIDVEGRAGHAGLAHRHHSDGGAVNAVEKAAYVLEAIRRLNDDWALRPRHPYLPPPICVPTAINGGEWIVSYPARCRLECHFEYLPGQADERGWGSLVEREFEEWIARAAAADPWLREHPPVVEWVLGGVPPAEVGADEPIVQSLLGAERDLGREARLGGLDNWHDGATLITEAGIPAVNYGPGDVHLAHTADEHVPIAELVACAQGIAVAAMRFCEVA